MLASLLAASTKGRRGAIAKIYNIVSDNERGIGEAFTDPETGAPGVGKLMGGRISLKLNLNDSLQNLP